MKSHHAYWFLGLSLWTGLLASNPPAQITVTPSAVSTLKDLSFPATKHRPAFHVELSSHTNGVDASSIFQVVVTSKSPHLISQTFPLPEVAPGFVLEGVDVNFDGYQDFRVLTALGATGNRSYAYWLFNPAQGQFEIFLALDDLNITEIDAQTKTLSGSWNGGANCRTYAAYRWEGGKCWRVLERQLGTAGEFRSRPECQELLLGYQDADLVEIILTFRQGRLLKITCGRWSREDQ